MRKETPWGTWDHLPLPEVVQIFGGLAVPWWIAGGYAIDAFAGTGRRDHDVVDVSLFASDQLEVQKHLHAWELHCADPPGSLRPWLPGEMLASHIHDIWVRRNSDDPWRFQLMLNPGDPAEYICRRDERVRMPLNEATFEAAGVRYLAPEIQLFFKAKSPRPKDEQDFADCLPLLSESQRAWLSEALEAGGFGREWMARLR